MKESTEIFNNEGEEWDEEGRGQWKSQIKELKILININIILIYNESGKWKEGE